MNQKQFFVISCLFFILSASMVFASEDIPEEGPYIGVKVGASFLDDAVLSAPTAGITVNTEFDTGYCFEGALGYDFGMARLEGEIGYRKNDIDKYSTLGMSVAGLGDSSALSFMMNGFFDIENQTPFTPYVGAGIGFAKVSIDRVNVGGIVIGGQDDTVFAYQFGAGVGYAVTGSVTLDLAYKYFATSDPEFGITDAEYSSHNLSIGVRYGF